ncbi:hypothetical protein WN48_07367 [Eufriesea mexicana]|nr:hypothetical protein WN48_07367 [Eufriesea mexicana]
MANACFFFGDSRLALEVAKMLPPPSGVVLPSSWLCEKFAVVKLPVPASLSLDSAQLISLVVQGSTMGGVQSGTHTLGEALWVHERQRQKCHRGRHTCILNVTPKTRAPIPPSEENFSGKFCTCRGRKFRKIAEKFYTTARILHNSLRHARIAESSWPATNDHGHEEIFQLAVHGPQPPLDHFRCTIPLHRK